MKYFWSLKRSLFVRKSILMLLAWHINGWLSTTKNITFYYAFIKVTRWYKLHPLFDGCYGFSKLQKYTQVPVLCNIQIIYCGTVLMVLQKSPWGLRAPFLSNNWNWYAAVHITSICLIKLMNLMVTYAWYPRFIFDIPVQIFHLSYMACGVDDYM